jgi:hypothetical protein
VVKRQGLLQLLGAAPLASLLGRPTKAVEDRRIRLHLGPGTYSIGPGGGMWFSEHGVRIEGCTFDGCRVEITTPEEATDPISTVS